MLGHKVFQVLRRELPGTACTLRGGVEALPPAARTLFPAGETLTGVDVRDETRLRALLEERRPDVVVNCVGVVKQRPEANDPLLSISVNSLLPHQLAAWCRPWEGRVIHVSTDCVFSGRRGPYREEDEIDATDLYGKTKALGELGPDEGLTLRTSIIGRELAHGASLLEWLLARRGTSVRGFTRVLWSGVTTNYLARLLARIVRERPDLAGLYQVAGEPVSKHELLVRLDAAFGAGVVIEPDPSPVSDRRLVGERFVAETGWRTPPWDALLPELASDPTSYDSIRKGNS